MDGVTSPARVRGYPLLAALVIALGLALRWQCLQMGFKVDDYMQLAIVEGAYPAPRSPVELYTFASGDRAQNDLLRRAGLLTWWSHPELKLSMFRPLTCALFWLDHALSRHDAFRYHLHSAAWWLAMCAALAALLRRVLPHWVALLALAIFVADEGHIQLLAWITNRNATIASTFALLGLLAQVRERQDGWRAGAWIALGCYLLALAGAEYALPFIGYALLYELSERAPRAQRVRRLALPGLLLCGYFACRALFGAGSSGSAMYRDPFTAPLEFVRDGVTRLALLVADVVAGLPATYWTHGVIWPPSVLSTGMVPLTWLYDLTEPRRVFTAVAMVCTAFACWIGYAALRGARASGFQDARWLILGAPLALLPMLSACAESRLAVPAVVGFCVIPPVLLHASWRDLRDRSGRLRGLAAAIASLFVLFHLYVPLTRGHSEAGFLRIVAGAARRGILDPRLDRAIRPDTRVMLFTTADPTTSLYGGFVRRVHRRPAPGAWHLLSSTFAAQRLTRLSERAFTLERVHPGYTAGDAYAEYFTDRPARAGQRFRAGDLEVVVEQAHAGRPLRTRYTFGSSLDHESLLFVTQTRRGLRPFTMPAVGGSAIVEEPFPAIDLLR
jgi:hypothetical protein